MGTGMVTGLAAVITLLALACLWLGVVLARARRANRRVTEEISVLRARLDQLETAAVLQASPTSEVPARQSGRAGADYVITTAGLPVLAEQPLPAEPPAPVEVRQFASVALGESLVRIAALAYGVRRALSAENRNRIGFEVRREIRRSRRQRKRELKEARRHLRATHREQEAA
jgi:hypothetical protein